MANMFRKQHPMKITMFEKFLYNRGLLENFKKNCHCSGKNYEEHIISHGMRYDAIITAFMWTDTPEGDFFWNTVEDEWIDCLNRNLL